LLLDSRRRLGSKHDFAAICPPRCSTALLLPGWAPSFLEDTAIPHLEFSDLTLLLVQVAVILLVSQGLGVVTRWLGQPLVIAEVLAGIVLGPSLLGWVWPEGMAALFPPTSLPILKMLSQFGLVLFMFLIGLELDPKLLKGRTHSSIAISFTSIVLPFVLGAAAARWLYDTYSSPDVTFVSFLLFLGTAMSVTAFPVLARILSERHLLTSRLGAITIACAAVDDVTAWCILAFVVAVARADGIAQAVWTTGLALVFIFAMLFLARPFLRRLSHRVASPEALTPPVVAVTLLFLLFSSTVTELIGIHALFGAFVFGAVLPKDGKLAAGLADKVETVAVVLLLPLFFAYSGLRTEIGLVSQPHEWIATGVVILLATVGKFGGSALAARLTGLQWREASAIGILMNTRGLMELIVLNVGMDLGVISPTVFTMLVIMALVTTFATSPVLSWVYPDQELARDSLVEPTEAVPKGAPPFTVMMCVSDSKTGPGLATVTAALLGQRNEPASLFALHLWDPTGRPLVELRRSDAERSTGPLAPLLAHARELMLDVRPLSFVSAEPAADILRTAEAKQTSLLLLGAHKPLLLEGRLSGTVSDVVAESHCPVGVLLDRGLNKITRVLVAYAGEPEDLAALEVARRIGRAPGTSVTLFHAVPPRDAQRPGKGRSHIASALQGLAEGRRTSPIDVEAPAIDQVFAEPDTASGALHVRVVEHASPPDAVLEECRRGYDLVVLGMHARWGLGAGMISSRRRRVLAEAPVSILAVHPPRGITVPRSATEPSASRLASSTSGS
jgi:Kef-type K+ transport system membrane component KefB/nucleotide-binding universal stress UspA family protein